MALRTLCSKLDLKLKLPDTMTTLPPMEDGEFVIQPEMLSLTKSSLFQWIVILTLLRVIMSLGQPLSLSRSLIASSLAIIKSGQCHKISYHVQHSQNESLKFLLRFTEKSKMISTKKLQKLARKWQQLAAFKRKRITWPQSDRVGEVSSCSTSTIAEKGHFVVYSADQKRFVLPIEAELVEYEIGLIKQMAHRDVQKALLTSIARSFPSIHLQHQPMIHQIPVSSF